MDTKKHSSFTQGDEEDYIDIEVLSSSFTKNSPPQSREFEFQSQMFSSSHDEKDSSPSPADELFYKGNLLPLHLPRRLQMVRKILENSAPPTITTSTPMESCSVSPSESCRVSCELNPDEYFFHWSTEILSNKSNYYTQQQNSKCWSKKLRLIKQSLITQKLKASRLYFKSLFSKSVCSSVESFPCADKSATELKENGSKIREFLNNSLNTKYFKFGKENPFEEGLDTTIGHRKSFSGAIKRHCSAKCISGFSASLSSSSSSSTASNCSSSGFHELNLINRSNKCSVDSETENAIEGAIAHCKKSQQQQCLLQHHTSVWIPSLKGSRSKQRVTGYVNHGNQELCRI